MYEYDLWRKSKGQRIKCKVDGNANAEGYQNYQNMAVSNQLTTLVIDNIDQREKGKLRKEFQ